MTDTTATDSSAATPPAGTGLSWIDGTPPAQPAPTSLLATALAWQARDISVVPIHWKDKRPIGQWKNGAVNRQEVAATEAEIRGWFGNGTSYGLGLICGYGALEMLELENKAITEGYHDRFLALLKERGLLELWGHLMAGYSERSPSGGIHILYRIADGEVPGNTALAKRPETAAEMDAREPTKIEQEKGRKKARPVVLIETRGKGGFTVAAPSVQPNGKAWTMMSGGPATVATITMAERDELHAAARELDEWKPAPREPVPAPAPAGEYREVQTSMADGVPWAAILEPHGWVCVGGDPDGDQEWRRPGKSEGLSATTHCDGGGLYVFTTSTDFEPSDEVGAYSKAAASAVLNDDMSPADALARYGTAQEATAAFIKVWGGMLNSLPKASTENTLPTVNEQSSADSVPTPDTGASAPSPNNPFADENAANKWAETRGGYIIPREGVLARMLGRDVLIMGQLAAGKDGRIWPYRQGVYVPEEARRPVIRGRCARLLKDDYRRSYATAAEDIVREAVPGIDCAPVEQYINVPNGLLDWRTEILYAHSPDVMSTVQLGVPWDARAKCPWFDWWLLQVVPPDCIELIWELIGYLAYSGNPLHIAVMLAGDGRNGKGTLLRVIVAILGAVNVTATSLADLVENRFRAAELFGKIANIAGDIDGTYLETTAKFKAITGNDLIDAERKQGHPFRFTPWAVPVFSANKIPASADTSAGYLSKWLVIPFPNSFEGKEDRTIEAKLHAELPGILAAGIRRLPALLERGQFGLTDSAREAKAEFSRKVDQVRYWQHECCELGSHPRESQTLTYKAYRRWVDGDGGKPLKASEFYNRLAATGVRVYRDAAGRWVEGMRVVDQCYGDAPFGGSYTADGGYQPGYRR
jgi:putative DNA primase/helicase